MQEAAVIRMFTFNGLFTCIYIPLVLCILNYYEDFYNIGKYQSFPVITAIVCGEFTKMLYNHFKHTSRDMQQTKNKKVQLKFSPKEVFKIILTVLTSICVYYFIAVLFGAAVFSQQEETFMFSILLTSLTILPVCLSIGCDNTINLLYSLGTYSDDFVCEIYLMSIRLTLFGAWLGSIVIPLDWDRPWQIWPIPNCFGAIVGYIISQLFMVLLQVPTVMKFFNRKNGKFVI